MTALDRFFFGKKTNQAAKARKSRLGSAPRFRPFLESLEELVLPATLDISGGSLIYTAGASVDNHLAITEPLGNYLFYDASEQITLTAGAVAAGWIAVDPNNVLGPKDSATVDFRIELLDGKDELSIDARVAVAGKIDLQSGNGIDFVSKAGALVAGSEVVLRADGGSVTQAAAATTVTAPLLTIAAATGAGTVAQPILTSVQNLDAKTTIAGSSLVLVNSSLLNVSQIQVPGDLQLSGVGLSQTGPISVGGKATLEAGSADLNLGLTTNAIAKAALQGTNLFFATASALEVTALEASADVSLSAPAGFSFPSDVSGINRLSILNLNANSSFSGNLFANQLQILSGTGAASLQIKGDATLPGGLTAQAGTYNLTLAGADNSIGALSLSQEGQLNLGDAKTDQTVFLGSAAISAAKLAVTIQGTVISQGDLSLFNWKGGSATDPITLVGNNLYIFGGQADGGLNLIAQGDVAIQAGVTAGSTYIKAASTLTLNGIFVAKDDFIFQGGSIIQAGNGELRVSDHTALVASGDIFLNSGNFFINEIQFVGKNVNLSSNTPMLFKVWEQSLPPSIANTAFGDLTLTTINSNITAETPLSVAGNTTINTNGNGNVVMSGFNNFSGPVNFNAVNVTIDNINDLIIAQGKATGSLSLDTAVNDANITQLGAIVASTGPIALNAGTGHIVLTNSLNDFSSKSATTVTASQAALFGANAIQLGAIAVSGAFSVTSGAAISQAAAIKAGSSSIIAQGAVTLGNAANVFGPLALTAQSAAITSAGALVLAGATIQGSFSVNAGGDITQTGPIVNNGLSADTSLTSTSKILLSGNGNDLVDLALSATMVDLRTIASVQISDSKITGLTKLVAGGDLTGVSNSFGSDAIFKAGANIAFEGTRSVFGGTVDFEGTNVSFASKGDFAILRGKARGALKLDSTGKIAQVTSTADIIEVDGESNLVAIDDILLNTAPNRFLGPISLVGDQIALSNQIGTTLGTTIAGSDLAISAGGFGILQNAKITVAGKATFDAGKGDILLAGDNAISQVSLSGRGIEFASGSKLTVQSLVASGDLGLSAPLGFTVLSDVSGVNRLSIANLQAGSSFAGIVSANQLQILSGSAGGILEFQGDTTLPGGLTAQAGIYDLTLSGAKNTIGALSLSQQGRLTLGDSKTDQTVFIGSAALSAAKLSVVIQGAVISQGDLTVFNWKGGSATEPITLIANNLYLFGGEADGGLNIMAQGEVAIQGQINAGKTDIKAGTTLTLNAEFQATGNFIFQGGSIIQAANGLLRVTDRTALVASGDIFLDNGNFFTNEIQFIGRNVTLGSYTPMLLKIWDGQLPPPVHNAAHGFLNLSTVAGDITAETPVYASGAATIHSGGNIVMTGVNELFGAVDFSGKDVSISDVRDLIIGKGNVTGSLTLNTSLLNRDITQLGPIVAPVGPVTIDAGTGRIILTNPLNDFPTDSTTTVTAAQADLFDASAIQLGAIAVSGAFSIGSGADITQSAPIKAGSTNAHALGATTLNDPANVFGPLALTAQSADIVSAVSLVLAGVHVQDILMIAASGDITQTGPIVTSNPFWSTLLSGNFIDLQNAGNDFGSLKVIAFEVTINNASSLDIHDSVVTRDLTATTLGSFGLHRTQIYGNTNILSGRNITAADVTLFGFASIDAAGSIDISQGSNLLSGELYLNGTYVFVSCAGDVRLFAGNASITYSITATGSIIQDLNQGYLNVSGDSYFSAQNEISINNQKNILVGSVTAIGNKVSIATNGPLVIDQVTAQSDCTLIGNGITAYHGLLVSGIMTAYAQPGDINFLTPSLLGHTTTLSGNNIYVSGDDIQLGTINATGNLSVKMTNQILGSFGEINVGGTTSLIAGTQINLPGDHSRFNGQVSLQTDQGAQGKISLVSEGSLTIQSVFANDTVLLHSEQNIRIMGDVKGLGAGPQVTLESNDGESAIYGSIRAQSLAWIGNHDNFGALNVYARQNIATVLDVRQGNVYLMGSELFPATMALEFNPTTFSSIVPFVYLNGHSQTFSALTGPSGTLNLGSRSGPGKLAIANDNDAVYSGVITGYGNVYKSGSGRQTFDRANTFVGDTQILQGTLQLGSATANGSVLGPIVIGDGTLALRPVFDQLMSNPIRNLDPEKPTQGMITVESPEHATLTMAGDNAFGGTTTILSGTLNLASNLANTVLSGADAVLTGIGTIKGNLSALQGTVYPGSFLASPPSGKLTITGEAVLSSQSTLRIGMASNTLYGVLNAGKTTLQGGTLAVTVEPSYIPPNLQTYTVLQATPPLTGKFAQTSFVFSNPYFFKTIYSSTSLVLQKVPSGVIPGATPLVVGPASGSSQAVIYDTTNQVRARIQPMGAGWLGGMRVAVGDVTGDGFADYIFAAGPGGGPRVVVIDAITLKQVSSFFAYGAKFAGGVYVASGDIDGNGIAEIVTGAGAGGGPSVQAFNYLGKNTGTSFMAYNSGFRGGVTVATGDLDGDKTAEIITGVATQGSPHVQAFHANGTSAGLSFFAYASSFMGGVSVAAGDLNGDGIAEIVTGPGFSGGPNLRVFSSTGTNISSIFAFAQGFTGGLTVGVIDPDHSGKSRIVAAPLANAANYPGPRVNLYDYDAGSLVFVTTLLAYPSPFAGGLWVS